MRLHLHPVCVFALFAAVTDLAFISLDEVAAQQELRPPACVLCETVKAAGVVVGLPALPVIAKAPRASSAPKSANSSVGVNPSRVRLCSRRNWPTHVLICSRQSCANRVDSDAGAGSPACGTKAAGKTWVRKAWSPTSACTSGLMHR